MGRSVRAVEVYVSMVKLGSREGEEEGKTRIWATWQQGTGEGELMLTFHVQKGRAEIWNRRSMSSSRQIGESV